MLKTKCILAEKSSADGIRFSVMSRHTENDGITPHPGITEETYDYWLHEVAPEDNLVGDYYKRGLSWEEFERRYLAYLREGNRPQLVREIAILALFEDVTLLCIEPTPNHCHRRLLAEECKRLVPWLRIDTKEGLE